MNAMLSFLFSGDLKLFHVCFTYIIPYMVYFFLLFCTNSGIYKSSDLFKSSPYSNIFHDALSLIFN